MLLLLASLMLMYVFGAAGSNPVDNSVTGPLTQATPITFGTSHLAVTNNSTANVSCATGAASGNYPQLVPAICVSPTTLCEPTSTGCPAGIPSTTNVHLWVNATGNSIVRPPYVQVVFVVETTLYDGVYDPSAGDYGCGSPGAHCTDANGEDPCGGPCFESDGVPYFVANAKQIAQTITEKNTGVASSPHVTFSMVDYFSTEGSDHDDGDGSEYNVDVSTFQQATTFGNTVNNMAGTGGLFGYNWNPATYVYGDSDFSDNFLDSSMITALYGALQGSGMNWVNNASTYHVVVWMGSTLPLDPAYEGSWTPTYSDWGGGNTSTCEPSYPFPGGSSPNCETLADVAAIAVREHVTIDAIDLPDGMTEVNSGDYATTGPATTNDVTQILRAGCYLALATGGNWEGPTPSSTGVGFTCSAASTGSGSGNLTDTKRSAGWSWANNPALGWALTNIKFPTIPSNVSAYGSRGDTFQFEPTSGFSLGPGGDTFSCRNNGTDISVNCSMAPHYPLGNGLGWGWPYDTMYLNDSWSVEFNVSVTVAFPSNLIGHWIPIDVCTTWAGCLGSVGNPYTEVRYTNYAFAGVNASFPPAWVKVVPTTVSTTPPGLGPPPGLPPVPPLPVPVTNPIGVGNPLGVNLPVGNPVTQSVLTSVTQPILVGQVVSTPVAQGVASAGFVGVFAALGVASRVRQKKMVLMKNVSKSGAPTKTAEGAGSTGSIGSMEG